MATEVILKHPSGLTKRAYLGWSWTSFFFGAFPALFRGDWMGFFIYFAAMIVLGLVTVGIGSIIFAVVWCIYYNRWHTRRLMERGYVVASATESIDAIKAQLGA